MRDPTVLHTTSTKPTHVTASASAKRIPYSSLEPCQQFLVPLESSLQPPRGRPMLTHDQVQFYQTNGYLHVKRLFSRDEAAELCREAHGIVDRMDQRGADIDATWGSSGQRGNTKLLHCHDAQFHSAAFARMIVDPRFCKAASQVMGTPNIELHHTKMFIKPPEKGSPFPMHQDYHYFPHARDTMIAAIVHLDDAPLEKGCL